MTYLTHLECSKCRKEVAANTPQRLCPDCQKPLLARYDLDALGKVWNPQTLVGRESTLWRFRELLPMASMSHAIRLGEGGTPLLHAKRLGKVLGLEHLLIKDEALNPTGSFKARGLCLAVSRACELGIAEVVIPSAGNAAGAMSAYAAAAGMRAHVFMPRDVPLPFRSECEAYGADVTLVDGLIGDCGAAAKKAAEAHAWFDVSTLKEPYRLEGKKTMGLELAEDLGWKLPDVIIYPTGGGTGLIGMWKAFDELERLGMISSKRPRMVVVQAEGCAPMVRAFEEGSDEARPWENASTIAAGLRVPAAVGDFLILRTVRESGGVAIAVSDRDLTMGQHELAACEGVFACPEGGATVAAVKRLVDTGWIEPTECVVAFNTGTGLKYPEVRTEGVP